MLTLILGGARSGKSEMALRLARASGRNVVFVATMEAGDDETRERIATHRAERPAAWRTVEAPLDLVAALRQHARPSDYVIIDCLTLWMSNMLLTLVPDADAVNVGLSGAALAHLAHEVDALVDWAAVFDGEVALVSNEVGTGVVPPYPLGRLFRDALGSANRAIAAHADHVYLLTAGLALDLRALGAQPVSSFGETAP